MVGKSYLISRTTQRYINYASKAIKLSKSTPYTVDEVLIGKKGKPCKKITTFRDSKGNLIERIFNCEGQPLRNRIYTHQENTIGENEIVNSTTIKNYYLERSLVSFYKKNQKEAVAPNKTDFWQKGEIQTNHISENIDNGDRILSVTKIKQIPQSNGQVTHSIVEYPAIKNGKIEKSDNKSLEYKVDNDYSVPKGSIKTKHAKPPTKDTYLGYRILDLEDAKIPLTKKFMRDRNVDNLGYAIDTDFKPSNNSDTPCALFDDGTIRFNKLHKFKSKSDFVLTSSHEVEHGWQYYLDARNGGQRGEYLESLGEEYGPIKDVKLQKEADKYTKSLDNYVPWYVDFKKYKKNYIEVCANKKGAETQSEYDRQGKTIRNDFKHIPKEML